MIVIVTRTGVYQWQNGLSAWGQAEECLCNDYDGQGVKWKFSGAFRNPGSKTGH